MPPAAWAERTQQHRSRARRTSRRGLLPASIWAAGGRAYVFSPGSCHECATKQQPWPYMHRTRARFRSRLHAHVLPTKQSNRARCLSQNVFLLLCSLTFEVFSQENRFHGASVSWSYRRLSSQTVVSFAIFLVSRTFCPVGDAKITNICTN